MECADLFQEDISAKLKLLQENLEIFHDCKLNWSLTADHIKV